MDPKTGVKRGLQGLWLEFVLGTKKPLKTLYFVEAFRG